MDGRFDGMICAMRTTMDRAGRVVLPKALREAARFRPGAPLDVRVVDGRIQLEPAPADVVLERRGGVLVAAPKRPRPELRAAEVEELVDSLRNGREG